MAIFKTITTFTPADAVFYGSLGEDSMWYKYINGNLVLAAHKDTKSYAAFNGVLPVSYVTGNPINIGICATAEDSVAGKSCIWIPQLQKHDLNNPLKTIDYGASSTGTMLSPHSNYNIKYVTAAHSSAGQLDGLVAGDMFTLLIYRFADFVGDDLAVTSYIFAVHVVERIS